MSKKAWMGVALTALLMPGWPITAYAQADQDAQPSIQNEAKPVKEAVWQADPKLKRYLGRQYVLGGYSVSRPLGYTDHLVRRQGLLANYWQEQATASGFMPYLALALAPAPTPARKGDKKLTADRLLNISTASMKRGFDDWTETEIEHGRINGISFVRIYWTGTDRQQKRKLRGVSYVAIDDTAAISLTAQDVARATTTPSPATADGNTSATPPTNDTTTEDLPETVDRLKLAEAVFQTLHHVTP